MCSTARQERRKRPTVTKDPAAVWLERLPRGCAPACGVQSAAPCKSSRQLRARYRSRLCSPSAAATPSTKCTTPSIAIASAVATRTASTTATTSTAVPIAARVAQTATSNVKAGYEPATTASMSGHAPLPPSTAPPTARESCPSVAERACRAGPFRRVRACREPSGARRARRCAPSRRPAPTRRARARARELAPPSARAAMPA